MRTALLIGAMTGILATSVRATEPDEFAAELAGELGALLEQKEVVKAAQHAAKALRAAQKKRDVRAELACAAVIRHAFAHLDPREKPETVGGYRDACHAMMRELPARELRASFSAFQLAARLVIGCVRSGDDRYLKEANALLSKMKGGGRYSQVMARLGKGVTLARERDYKSAMSELSEVLKEAKAHRFLDAYFCAAVEIDQVLLATRQLADGPSTLILGELQRSMDPITIPMFIDIMATRLRDYGGSDQLLETMRSTAEEVRKTLAPPVAAPASGIDVLASKWDKWSSMKPLVSARIAGALELELPFADWKKSITYPERFTYYEHAGVTLAMWQRGIALHGIDVTGKTARPADGFEPPAWEFLYYLADDETWTVTKTGVVKIK